MIQLSFTKDHSTPTAIWFDEDFEDKPTEHYWHFYGYQYLTEKDAEQMLDDPYVTQAVKDELQNALA